MRLVTRALMSIVATAVGLFIYLLVCAYDLYRRLDDE
jgi:hypothetical protein